LHGSFVGCLLEAFEDVRQFATAIFQGTIRRALDGQQEGVQVSRFYEMKNSGITATGGLSGPGREHSHLQPVLVPIAATTRQGGEGHRFEAGLVELAFRPRPIAPAANGSGG